MFGMFLLLRTLNEQIYSTLFLIQWHKLKVVSLQTLINTGFVETESVGLQPHWHTLFGAKKKHWHKLWHNCQKSSKKAPFLAFSKNLEILCFPLFYRYFRAFQIIWDYFSKTFVGSSILSTPAIRKLVELIDFLYIKVNFGQPFLYA